MIDNLTPHMFRHTYATMLYNAGMDVKSTQRFLGHADNNMTLKIYTHRSVQKEQEAIASLNRHLSQRKPEILMQYKCSNRPFSEGKKTAIETKKALQNRLAKGFFTWSR